MKNQFTLIMMIMGVNLASCGAADVWETFRDARGVTIQAPQGWRATLDSGSTRVVVDGPSGERMTIWPVYMAQPLSQQSAAAMLPLVARKQQPAFKWEAAAEAGVTAVKMVGNTRGQVAVASVTWVNSTKGTAAYFMLNIAPEGKYQTTAPVFARIFQSLVLTSPKQSAIESVRWTDPQEKAFSLEVPARWRVEGGTVRRASVDTVFTVKMTSPDGSMRVTGGDATVPTFVLPNQMLQWTGFQEGSWYSPGYGVRMQVRRYLPGLQFAEGYVASKMGQAGCNALQILQKQDRTVALNGINAQLAQFRSMGMDLKITGGDVSFTCQQHGRQIVGYYFASTMLTNVQSGMGLWSVDQLYGYTAPAESEQEAEEVLHRGLKTAEINPQWAAMQQGLASSVSKIATQTNAEIARMSRDSFERQQNINSEAMRKWSNAQLGVLDARDPRDGRILKVDNAANYHWIDVNGKIIGTNTDSVPKGIDPRPLVTLP